MQRGLLASLHDAILGDIIREAAAASPARPVPGGAAGAGVAAAPGSVDDDAWSWRAFAADLRCAPPLCDPASAPMRPHLRPDATPFPLCVAVCAR